MIWIYQILNLTLIYGVVQLMWVDELEAMLDGLCDDLFFSSELTELGLEGDLGCVASEEAAGPVDQGISDLSTPCEAREWVNQSPNDEAEPPDILTIIKTFLKDVRKCHKAHAVMNLLPLTALTHYVKLSLGFGHIHIGDGQQ
jgi:hypothetical protein